MAADNWRGLEKSLQTLRLGRNSIDRLPADAFAGLTFLEYLDLRENSLKDIDPSVFRDGMAHLTHLYLNDNQLNNIPYQQLSYLKRMRVLDLSYNHISHVIHPHMDSDARGVSMSLDVLRLDYNQIFDLPPESFQHFSKINKTYLNGNPITKIEVKKHEILLFLLFLNTHKFVIFSKVHLEIQEYENFFLPIVIFTKSNQPILWDWSLLWNCSILLGTI